MPNTPSQNNLALSLLRRLQGWSQKELAAASGVPGNLLSDYEKGRKPLSRERLEMLASTMGRAPEFLEQVFTFLRTSSASAPVAGRPSDAQSWRMELVVSDVAAMAADFTRSVLTRVTTAARVEQERLEAEALWARLKTTKPPERRRLVEAVERFRSWALCELVCRESVDAARDSADRALELADLALYIAELTPGDEAWRSQVQGYAWAHVGNARRVKGNLPGADEAFRCAGALWPFGDEGGAILLDETRMLDLEASLRREQGRFDEALSLLDRALSKDRGEHTQRILLNRATTLEALGNFEEAVKTLNRAAPLVEARGEPRLVLALRFNLAVNLCWLERYDKAKKLLPEIRGLATAVENGLDFVRMRWLEGRVAAGLGGHKEAILAYARVQEELTARGIGFDAALVTLEMASIYLAEGRTAEVRALARQMMWIFKSQGVHREVLAALQLFFQAADRGMVSRELTQRLIRYLLRAQFDPSLKFNDSQ